MGVFLKHRFSVCMVCVNQRGRIMANGLYDSGREGFLAGSLDWDAHNIKISLIDAADYTANLATDDFYNDVIATPAAEVAVSGNLSGKTTTAGVADANDITFTAVTGDPSENLVGWRDTGGAASTNPLILFIDTATGLPVTPNGGDINVAWSNAANRIFKL